MCKKKSIEVSAIIKIHLLLGLNFYMWHIYGKMELLDIYINSNASYHIS